MVILEKKKEELDKLTPTLLPHLWGDNHIGDPWNEKNRKGRRGNGLKKDSRLIIRRALLMMKGLSNDRNQSLLHWPEARTKPCWAAGTEEKSRESVGWEKVQRRVTQEITLSPPAPVLICPRLAPAKLEGVIFHEGQGPQRGRESSWFHFQASSVLLDVNLDHISASVFL